MGIDLPKIEIRYEQLSVEGEVHVGSRALPTLLNAAMNTIEVFFSLNWVLIQFSAILLFCYSIRDHIICLHITHFVVFNYTTTN